MAHYAFLDGNNTVTEVIVGKDEGQDGINWEQWYGESFHLNDLTAAKFMTLFLPLVYHGLL